MSASKLRTSAGTATRPGCTTQTLPVLTGAVSPSVATTCYQKMSLLKAGSRSCISISRLACAIYTGGSFEAGTCEVHSSPAEPCSPSMDRERSSTLNCVCNAYIYGSHPASNLFLPGRPHGCHPAIRLWCYIHFSVPWRRGSPSGGDHSTTREGYTYLGLSEERSAQREDCLEVLEHLISVRSCP